MTRAGNNQAKAGVEAGGGPNYRLKLNKIIDAAMRKYRSLYTYSTLRPDLKKHIEQCVCENLSDLHTPDHPTYALMIWRAIEGLNEEEGSTEEAISKFIKEDVKDLPWAHASFLRHHLNKLSESGEIVRASENCYKLPAGNKNSLKRKCWQLNGAGGQIEPIEEQKPAEERSEPEPHVNYIEKQIQLLEEQILLIEKLIELQWQKNEVIEKQNKLQNEARSKMVGLREMENGEATVRSQSSYFEGQRLENGGSSLLSKDKFIKLLKKTKKIEEHLMYIINSSSVSQVSDHDIVIPGMEEQEKENLMKPEHKQQVEFSNQRNPLQHEVETSQKKSIKKKMQVKRFCGQQEAPECLTKSTRTSLNAASELRSHPMPLELLPIMSSLDALSDSQALEHVEQVELPYSGGPLLLESSKMEPSGQKEQQLKAALHGKGKAHDYQQLEQEQQLNQHHHKLQQLVHKDQASSEYLDQGRQLSHQSQFASQPEQAVNDTVRDSLPSKNWHHQQQQLERKGQARRPPRLEPNLQVALGGFLLSDDQHQHGTQLPKHRSRERPSKSKGDDIDLTTTAIVALPTVLQNQNGHQIAECHGQTKLSTIKSKAGADLQVSMPLGNRKHNELQQQRPERQGRGRPPKRKPVLATTMEASPPSLLQERLKHRGRERPPKRRLEQKA